MRGVILFSIALVYGGFNAGCQSRPTARAPGPALPISVVAETRVEPRLSYLVPSPSGPVPAARVEDPTGGGHAVYTPPKIVKTVLAAYEDEKGRLFGPQEMYEKVEEGRFNVGALENPELAYIPPENLVVPPGMGNPASIPATRHRVAEGERLPTDLLDARDVVPTGLFSEANNRAEAERLASHAGKRARFDPDLGWILVPNAATQ